MVKLGEVASYINGYAFKPEDRGSEGLPIIRIQDLTGNSYDLGYYSGNYPKKIEINDGDILISWSASLGVYTWNKGKALLNQHIFKVEFIEDSIDKKYFVYAVRKKIDEMIRKSHGATMKHIIKKDFEDTIIPYPTLEEQYKIADELDRISKIIDMRNQELRLHDDLIRARFVEMFGDIIINDRLWKNDNWSNVVKIVNGKNQKSVESNDGKYVICGSGGIMGRATDYLTEENSVIIGRKGNINKPILMREKYWNVDTAFGVEPNENYICVEYLYMFCLFFDFNRLNKAVTIPSLTKMDLLNISMPIPDLHTQKRFATFVGQVDKSKVEVQKALDKAQLLFDSLMQKYFG